MMIRLTDDEEAAVRRYHEVTPNGSSQILAQLLIGLRYFNEVNVPTSVTYVDVYLSMLYAVRDYRRLMFGDTTHG